MAIAGSTEIYKKLSSQIESQFPGFIREEGPQFVTFLKAYYEYMEQNGKAINATRSIQDYQDIDRTIDNFVEYFRREFMPNIPKDVLADQRLLVKHIREFYQSRGTPESYRFLFRALYNKEIEFYYPGEDILRTSDGRWIKESKLRVAKPYTKIPTEFGGIKVTGAKSGATALVQSVDSSLSSGITIYDMTVENIKGTFLDGERVFDADGNYATVSAQIGPISSYNIYEGGALHNIGDTVRIYGAGSTSPARGTITRVKSQSALTARIVKTGSGYTKKNTKIIVSNEDGGEGFEAVVSSYWPEAIPTALNTDLIGDLKNVRLDSDFFVRKGANSANVTKKLTGILKAKTSSNTVYGISGSRFNTELAVGDVVRITGSSTALRVHSIGGAQTFVATARTNVNARANGYSKLAGANVSSTLNNSLSFSSSQFYKINAISIINPGKNYTSIPTLTIIDTEISKLNVDDGYGGFLGKNAAIVANTITGTIAEIKLTEPGSNFNKFNITNIINETQGNNVFGALNKSIGISVSHASVNVYTILKKTYSGTGFGTPTGVTNYPGKYVDTKSLLNSSSKLQDNFYYQEFSYVIRVSELLDKYREIIKKLVHPAGTKFFADYQMISSVATPAIVTISTSSIQNITMTETVASTDTVVGAKKTSAVITESTSVTDSMSSGLNRTGEVSESVTVSDNTDTIKFAGGLVSESITATDTVSTTVIFINLTADSESVTVSDSIDNYNNAVGEVSESATATDTTNGTSAKSIALIETMTATDTIVGNGITSSDTAESVTASETVNGTYITPNLNSGSESVTVSDSIDNYNNAVGAVSESATATDDQNATYVSANVSPNTESVTASDSTLGGISLSVDIGSESVTPTDSTQTAVLIGSYLTEIVTVSDSSAGTYVSGNVSTGSESVTAADSVVGTNRTSAGITESNGELTPYASVLISTYQSTVISDVVNPTLNLDDTVGR
jgi:hypothetical protein